jgi:hypothetical protein
MRDAIAELEAWKHDHKARACCIEIDNSYGATCWTVKLYGEDNGAVLAAEVSFYMGTPARNAVFLQRDLEDGTTVRPDGTPVPDDAEVYEGLGPTILAALDHWNTGHRHP